MPVFYWPTDCQDGKGYHNEESSLRILAHMEKDFHVCQSWNCLKLRQSWNCLGILTGISERKLMTMMGTLSMWKRIINMEWINKHKLMLWGKCKSLRKQKKIKIIFEEPIENPAEKGADMILAIEAIPKSKMDIQMLSM